MTAQTAQAPASTPTPSAQTDRSWRRITFDGLEPDDERSTLFRKWRGQIVALRSDGQLISINIVHLQQDSPAKIGAGLTDAFDRLESFRNCLCRSKAVCSEHIDTVENCQGGPITE